MNEKQELAQGFLISILDYLKKEGKTEGFAYVWLEEIIEIAFLNDFKDIMEQALSIRNTKTRLDNRLSGAITNIKPTSIPIIFDLPNDKIELEKKYSYENVVNFLKVCKLSEDSALYVTSPKEVKSALEIAKDDFELEAIACSLCVNGHFSAAQSIIENELSTFEYRIETVKMVMCIELFRKSDIDHAKVLLNSIHSSKDSIWSKLQFARGILGYQPWGGYPFSDY
ncbi:MAG: hypothetical protein GC192_06060 [Bacteroidetes bacterium]|nr:hypothetical protein [Bacteroidota bacterium]